MRIRDLDTNSYVYKQLLSCCDDPDMLVHRDIVNMQMVLECCSCGNSVADNGDVISKWNRVRSQPKHSNAINSDIELQSMELVSC